jgi:eukaryotic-like serine/threonine-protein kinase
MDQQSEAQQLVGAVFNGRWRLMRLVGEGGMGAVFEAHGLQGDGVRAVKVLHPEFHSEDQILNRFLAEAEAVKLLQHPNVAQIYGSARAEDGTPYLIMELLQGAPLSNFMTPGQPMPAQQGAGIMLGVLQALNVAHTRGVVHRDLKPDNLFLVSDGRGNRVVKVLDFGIAKVMDAAGGMGSKTKTGVLLGTPGYMSPEQIKNSKGVDARSDLWSVGIILYELLSGQEAFPADNEFTRLTMVLTQDIRPIGQVAPHLSNWASFFQRALSKDPNGRFQSAAEMSQALAAMMSGSSSSQGRDGGTAVLNVNSPHSMGAPPSVGHHVPAPPSGSPAAMPRTNASPQTQQAMQAQPPSQQYPHSMGGAVLSQQAPQRISVPPPQPHNSSGSAGDPLRNFAVSQPLHSSQNPSTHISVQRPPGVPTLTQGSRPPGIEIVTAPPVGVPWWVVAAVGAACGIVGFLAGYFAR